MSMFEGFQHFVRENENLAPFTRLGIGGAAQYFAEPTNREELVGIVEACHENEVQVRLIGSGSNLLVSDDGVKGMVVSLGGPAFGQIEVSESGLTAGGGAKLSQFVSTAVREGFAGPERLVGLPGTIGGALHNNTGAHGVDIGTWVRSAEVLTRTGEVKQRSADSMSFSYRQSSLNELVILNAEFTFEKESAADLTKAMQKLWISRRANEAGQIARSAYMFQDVGSETASDVIRQAGVSGVQVGSVSMIDENPNFFVAEPGAKSGDVIALIHEIKKQVNEKLEVDLQTAIKIW